jgi:hypothetical protein
MISETEPRADELVCDRGPVIMLSRRQLLRLVGVIPIQPVSETYHHQVVSLSYANFLKEEVADSSETLVPL